ncbi:FAD-dependent oxidoreductase [Roseimicrobium sp. ORNL1]|uniref:dihydrolipoyl dehydrogenase family protein n=1 Tax=Roseimicrobium sp. ORNL1 TaxID=2711231 RepID=UPI0013E11623|nr:FAD-dependent oxidoreductase [Roseimicrobium sp. ORNL1]QIF01687.1 FAD-dependent oxidoreductase [Roseimicrobium sp. ORNL1]
MSIEHFDFAILGGGSAGYAAARTAHGQGMNTVVIDGAEELGGLCILRGCMPSKTLIESANRAISIRHAAEFGLSATAGPVDTKAIRDRKRRLIGEFASYRQQQLEDGRFKLIRGYGTLEDAGEEKVRISIQLREGGTQTITTSYVLIATGSVINCPDIAGLHEAKPWNSDTILDHDTIPESFIVLGGGAIALEMAHYLDGIGRKVTVLQRNTQLLTGMDKDVADVVYDAFEKRGIDMYCGTSLQKVVREGDKVRATFTKAGAEHTVEAAEVLCALGRAPNTKNIGLDNLKIAHSDNGLITTQPTQQTTHPRVFAAGDVCGPLEVVHLAVQQGEVAAKNAALQWRHKEPAHSMDYRCLLFGVFTHPQVACVGLNELEARKKNIPHLVSTYPFNDHGKSMVMGEMDGFVKILAHSQNGAILGASVVGPEATELIHEIAVAMHLGATVAQLARAPHYHPTLSEIWTYPAEDLEEQIAAK